jgi:fumarate reductase flavoprotein subunit
MGKLSSKKGSKKKLEAELVVIGGGGAGLSAAVAAAERGTDVIILEKLDSLGGNAAKAGGIFAAESPVQRRLRIDARKDVCFQMQMEYSHYKINPRLWRAFVDKSGDTVRWLEDMGLEIPWISPYYPNQTPLTWHTPKNGGSDIVQVLIKKCKELGVNYLLNTTINKLIKSKNGRLIGVSAEQAGKSFEITTRCVIIATGGFAGNKKMIEKYSSVKKYKMLNLIGLPHMGEGIKMAIEMGADTEGLGDLHLTGPSILDNRPLTSVTTEPNAVFVNKKGERYIDEVAGLKTFICVNAILRQPEMISYTLLDSDLIKFLEVNGFTKGLGSLFRIKEMRSEWMNALQKEIEENGSAIKSESWEDIANWMGADPDVLKSTIDEYNACCDRGHDPLFAKDRMFLKPLCTPPYYAIKAGPGMIGTMGGIKINEHMEVVDKKAKPIPGLYAAGSDAGGCQPDTYNINLAGATFGFAVNSGRIAGENASKYVRDE